MLPLISAVDPQLRLRALFREHQADAGAVGRGLAGRRVVHLEDQRRARNQARRRVERVDAAGGARHICADRRPEHLRRRPVVRPERLPLIVRQRGTAGLPRGNLHVVAEREKRHRPRRVRVARRGRRCRRGPARVDDHVMHDAAVAGPHFEGLHPFVFGEIRRHLEILVGDRAACGNRVVLLHRQHRVGLADRPACRVLAAAPAGRRDRLPARRPTPTA